MNSMPRGCAGCAPEAAGKGKKRGRREEISYEPDDAHTRERTGRHDRQRAPALGIIGGTLLISASTGYAGEGLASFRSAAQSRHTGQEWMIGGRGARSHSSAEPQLTRTSAEVVPLDRRAR